MCIRKSKAEQVYHTDNSFDALLLFSKKIWCSPSSFKDGISLCDFNYIEGVSFYPGCEREMKADFLDHIFPEQLKWHGLPGPPREEQKREAATAYSPDKPGGFLNFR